MLSVMLKEWSHSELYMHRLVGGEFFVRGARWHTFIAYLLHTGLYIKGVPILVVLEKFNTTLLGVLDSI